MNGTMENCRGSIKPKWESNTARRRYSGGAEDGMCAHLSSMTLTMRLRQCIRDDIGVCRVRSPVGSHSRTRSIAVYRIVLTQYNQNCKVVGMFLSLHTVILLGR